MDKLHQLPVTYVDGDLQTVASWSATLSSMESNFSFYPYDILYIHVVMFRYLVCLITLKSMQPWFKGTPVHFMKRFSMPEVSLLRWNRVKHLHTETRCYKNTDIHHSITTYLIGTPYNVTVFLFMINLYVLLTSCLSIFLIKSYNSFDPPVPLAAKNCCTNITVLVLISVPSKLWQSVI